MTRPGVRTRLTLVYGGLFLLGGAVLLALNYALVERGLERRGPVGIRIGGIVPAVPVAPPPPGGVGPLRAPLPADRFVTSEGEPLPDVIEDFEADLRRQTLRELVVQSGVALGLMAVASVGLGWVVAGRVLRPLHDITATARRLSETNLHERIALEGPPDELKELADTFDEMLARLDAAFAGQRRFVANASHELRTPLAVVRAELDLVLSDPDATADHHRAAARRVREAGLQAERLIDGLLVLARSEHAAERREPADLAVAAADALDAVDAVDAQGLRVSASLDDAPVVGDRPLVERLVANLVENAVRHNHPGGWVEVETGRDGEGASYVTVRNSGPVVAAADVPALFEPFRRLAPDRTGAARGAGLGLSIVRSVAQAHGGAVEARPRPDGGLDVTARFPARP